MILPEIINNAQIDTFQENITMCIFKASELTLPKVKYKKYLKPYWSNELRDVHANMLVKRKQWLKENKPREPTVLSYKEYKDVKADFRRRLRKAFNQYMSEQFEEIDRSGEIDNRLLWQLFKSKKSRSRYTQTEIKHHGKTFREPSDILEVWASHFENLFKDSRCGKFDEYFYNHIMDSIKDIETNIHEERDVLLHNPITNDEVKKVCKSLKTGKAGGCDGIVYEHLLNGS